MLKIKQMPYVKESPLDENDEDEVPECDISLHHQSPEKLVRMTGTKKLMVNLVKEKDHSFPYKKIRSNREAS